MQLSRNKICGNCGSKYFISDRSLGGRIVCKICGSSSVKSLGLVNSKNKNVYYLLLIFSVFLLILII